MAEVKRALELDPPALVINQEVGMTLYTTRQYDQAIGQYRRNARVGSRLPPGAPMARGLLSAKRDV